MKYMTALLMALSACSALPVSRAQSELERAKDAYQLFCLTKPPVSISLCNQLSDKIAQLK